MNENISEKFNVLDFIITVLAQHEKTLSESLDRLTEVLNQLEKYGSSENTGNHPSREMERPQHHPSTILENPLKSTEYALQQIDIVILNLTIKGNSIEEIAERLDVNPQRVKGTVEELKNKGFLPHTKDNT